MPDEHPDPLDEGVEVIASISGGKDSTAMALWLMEKEIPFTSVFMDTGWEAEETYDYIRGPLTERIGPIVEISGKRKMEELIRHKQMFPSRVRRFCTQDLKIRPFAKWLKENTEEPVIAVGIRAGESYARSKMGEWEFSDWADGWTWRPLINFTEEDVVEMHTRHDMRPNPLYLKGARRVGCFPCIFARKSEIALVDKLAPKRIDLIEELEADITKGNHEKAAKRGEKPRLPLLTYFHPRRKGYLAIRDVVKWAKTDWGGDQYMLFDRDPPGCMRWGLCDSLPPEDDEE